MKAKTILEDSLPTSSTTLYTVPDNVRAKFVLAFISNGTGSTISDVHLQIVRDSTTITIIGSKSLGSGDYIQLETDGGYVMLEAGDQVKGDAGTAGISCILTFEETPFLVSTA
jgi:hypothetical protein